MRQETDRKGRPGTMSRRRQRKVCFFTQNNVEPDYKDVETLRRFISERGKILPRRLTGTTSLYQRKLATSIKQARHLALLPFVAENIK